MKTQGLLSEKRDRGKNTGLILYLSQTPTVFSTAETETGNTHQLRQLYAYTL